MISRNKVGVVSVIFGLALGVVGVAGAALSDRTSSPDEPKVVICHATDSENNPYSKIEVDQSSVAGRGHGNHIGPVWYPGAKAAGVRWGDIIPPIAGVTLGLNWPAGEATFNSEECELAITAPTTDQSKVVICHATNSEKNPYNKIEVDQSSVAGRGHGNHIGPVWYPGAKAAGVRWGDIIPPIAGVTLGLNWPAGEATFNNGCELPGDRTTTKPTKPTKPTKATKATTTTTG